jgi:hypothetical protein
MMHLFRLFQWVTLIAFTSYSALFLFSLYVEPQALVLDDVAISVERLQHFQSSSPMNPIRWHHLCLAIKNELNEKNTQVAKRIDCNNNKSNAAAAVVDPYQVLDTETYKYLREMSLNKMCAIQWQSQDSNEYTLKTIERRQNSSDSVANDYDSYIITHAGHCGTCSTLQDLAIYLKYR